MTEQEIELFTKIKSKKDPASLVRVLIAVVDEIKKESKIVEE